MGLAMATREEIEQLVGEPVTEEEATPDVEPQAPRAPEACSPHSY